MPDAPMAPRFWRAGYGVRVFGAACLLLAVAAYVALEEPLDATLAFALGLVGLFSLLVLTEKVLPSPAAEASMQGPSLALEDLAEGLSLKGRATVVPPGGNLTHDRLFLAAAPSEKPLPVLDDATVLYAAPSTVRAGVAVEPPGSRLVDAWEESSGERARDLPAAALPSFVSGLGMSQGLFARFRLRAAGERFEASFEALDVLPPCMAGEARDPPPCARTGCALCSAACVALARNLQRPVTVVDARVAQRKVTLTLEPERI